MGFDISTTCIGISVFSAFGELIDVTHLELKTDKDVLPEHRYLAKANTFKEYIQHFKDKYNILHIFIEEPLVGANNANTRNLLMKFNGICSYLLHQELNTLPDHISVRDIRKTLCPERIKIVKGQEVLSFVGVDMDQKDYIFNKIKNKYPAITWLKDKKGNSHKFNYDMSDAIAVTLASLINKKVVKL